MKFQSKAVMGGVRILFAVAIIQVPGTVYMVELCAMGGTTVQSPWSNPVSIMST